MLHVFHLDAGRMLCFDVGYAGHPVSKLKDQIQKAVDTSPNDQILMVSGGKILDSSKKVSSYDAGVDSSNPIFLILRDEKSDQIVAGSTKRSSFCASKEPLSEPQISKECETIFLRQLKLSPNDETFRVNVKLAHKCVACTDELSSSVFRLVNEQHLTHQGWFVVMAHLSDSVKAFKERNDKFRQKFNRFLSKRDFYAVLLEELPQDLETLKKVPILQCLLENSAKKGAEEEQERQKSKRKSISDITLYDWIIEKEPESSFGALAQDARYYLDQIIDPDLASNVVRWEDAVNRQYNDPMSEIKGMGERLAQLNNVVESFRKSQANQQKLSDQVVSCRGDPTLKPDVVWRRQLDILKELCKMNRYLFEQSQRVFQAKQELLFNVRVRLKWIRDTHDLIQKIDRDLVVKM
uniref:Ubiquitin-like domain-containing protein n=1 Tax=Romanomermis culicivorax TaxID=13658 RepID=A0A915J2Q1_ROMCU